MADAADSKSATRKGVKVRLLSPAPVIRSTYLWSPQERSPGRARKSYLFRNFPRLHFDRYLIRRIHLTELTSILREARVPIFGSAYEERTSVWPCRLK